MSARILVASDGEPGAAGALRMAKSLAESTGARLEVLAVCEPLDFYAVGSPDGVMANVPPQYASAVVRQVEQKVRAQLAEMGDPPGGWHLAVEVGPVAPMIAAYAARRGSSLIVIGLHEEGAVSRWLSRETLLRVIHLAHVPVLAVPAAVSAQPRLAVAAVDFSDFSLRAAHQALAELAPGARLHLIHVSPAPAALEHWMVSLDWLMVYRADAERRLKALAATLESAGPVAVEVHVRSGDAGREILGLAEQLGADLIAAGSHGAGFLGRLLMGSVSGTLVHDARCSLLIAPPQTIPSELQLDRAEGVLQAQLGGAG
jgi:nucleotide-binding universal stress UspA family protein